MRPYNHIKAKHASLTLKHYVQMDSASQTSKRERELTASVQADFTILGKTGVYNKKESWKKRKTKLFLMILRGMLFESQWSQARL